MSAPSAYAQSTAGRFSGTVTDASTSLVPGVKVSAINVDTGQTITETTNGQGQFVLYPLPPGVYNITLEKTGFSRYTIDGVRVEVSSSLAATSRSKWARQYGYELHREDFNVLQQSNAGGQISFAGSATSANSTGYSFADS